VQIFGVFPPFQRWKFRTAYHMLRFFEFLRYFTPRDGGVILYNITPFSSALRSPTHNVHPSTFTTSLPPPASDDMNPSAHLEPPNTGAGHKNSFNVANSYNTNYNIAYVDENPQFFESLSPLEPRLRHQDVCTRRLDGLGDWILQKDDFINWRDGDNGSSRSTLFCSCAPGAWKTYLR